MKPGLRFAYLFVTQEAAEKIALANGESSRERILSSQRVLVISITSHHIAILDKNPLKVDPMAIKDIKVVETNKKEGRSTR
jgi:hypothetical protein